MAEQIDFRLDTDLAPIANIVIRTNFAETKESLTQMMRPYQSLLVDEEGIAKAKDDRAKIRTIAKRIDEVRMTVKKAYSAPLTAFEAECKELVSICDSAAKNLDEQVKNYEEAEKSGKVSALLSYFNAVNTGEAKDYLTFEDIFNQQWRNKGFAIETAKMEINRQVSGCNIDIGTIHALNSPFETTLLDLYRNCHDIRVCIARNSILLDLQKKEDEKKAAVAAQRAKEEAQEKAKQGLPPIPQESEPTREEPLPAQFTPPTMQVSDTVSDVQTIDFRVYATQVQLMALRDFMKQNGIRYGRVPKDER